MTMGHRYLILERWRPFIFGGLLLAAVIAVSPPATGAELKTKQVFDAVVRLVAEIPAAARTAAHLGTQRAGHAVVIDSDGLALTIGYLILEAETVHLTPAGGKAVPARILAYDHGTGFGLVRALGPLGVKPIRFGVRPPLAKGPTRLSWGMAGQTRRWRFALSHAAISRGIGNIYWRTRSSPRRPFRCSAAPR